MYADDITLYCNVDDMAGEGDEPKYKVYDWLTANK